MSNGIKASGGPYLMKSFNLTNDKNLESKDEEAFPRSRARQARKNPLLPHRNLGGGAKKRALDHDYEYPPDEYGGEMGSNARVWRVYLDEADRFDDEIMEGFRDTTDVLLVFAGLFSAVVTTFVAQSSQALQPNYAQITASLMTELVSMQRAFANGTPIAAVKPSELSITSETTNTVDRWINWLWFTSLTLSLIVSLIAVLVKEWLQYYHSALSGTARERVLVRHFRFMGLDRWKVPAIIGILPVLLHVSLWMFLAGLVVYVWDQSKPIAYTILVLSGISYVLYVASSILGGLRPDCSYKSPISDVVSYLKQILLWIPHLRIRLSYLRRRRWPFTNTATAKSPKELEREQSEQQIDHVLLEALRWLHSASSNPTNKRMVYLALAGIPFNLSQVNLVVDQHLTMGIQQESEASVCSDESGLSDQTEVLIRSLALNHPVVSNNLLKQLQTAMNSHDSPVQALVACSLVHSLENKLISVTTTFLIDLVSSQAQLPPTVWKSLFQRHLATSEASESFRLVIMLLRLLAKAHFEPDSESKANWLLPSSIALPELCESEPRMSFVVLTFICWHLIDGSNADAARELLDAPESKFDGHVILVHVFLSVLDRLHGDMRLSREDEDGMLAECLASVEDALFLLPTRLWCKPAFVQAIYQIKELRGKLASRGVRVSSRLRFNAASKSLAPLMSYMLDVLEHPWPLVRHTGFDDYAAVSDVLAALFDAQDVNVYNTLLENDGLAVFRRCVPIDLIGSTWSSKVVWKFMVTLRDALTSYINSLSNPRIVDEYTRQQHLEYIFRPINLAWLIWLSRYYNPHQRLLQDLFDSLRALRPDSRSWTSAAQILVDELHRDAASYGLGHKIWSDHYFGLKSVLKQLNLDDEFVLYGYVSRLENNPDFTKVETQDPVHRPYVVRFSPRPSRLRRETIANRYYRVET